MDEDWYNPERDIPQRHKSSDAEMSQVTLSPSPITFQRSSTGFASFSQPSAPASQSDFFFERRRTPHPHNIQHHNQSQESELSIDMLPQRSRPPQSRLPVLFSGFQSVIDLTEEGNDTPQAAPTLSRAPSQRPPQLGRSDAQSLPDLIDLTDDGPEIQITGARNRELPLPRPDVVRPRPYIHRPRHDSPDGLFVRRDNNLPRARINLDGAIADAGGFGGFGLSVEGHLAHILQSVQAMPGHLDYRFPAFTERVPDHEPPKPARQGFTRSPTEDQTIICPSCEQELIHNKDNEEPSLKKNGKALTKKEREEHPYWVLRECGHVYCNHCFQNRTKPGDKVSFPEKQNASKSKKTPMCAVDDCTSEVREKSRWIGVFF